MLDFIKNLRTASRDLLVLLAGADINICNSMTQHKMNRKEQAQEEQFHSSFNIAEELLT